MTNLSNRRNLIVKRPIAIISIVVILVTFLTACGGSSATLSGKYYVNGDEDGVCFEFAGKEVTDSSTGLVCKYKIDGSRLIISVGAFDVVYTLSKDKKDFTSSSNIKYIKK